MLSSRLQNLEFTYEDCEWIRCYLREKHPTSEILRDFEYLGDNRGFGPRKYASTKPITIKILNHFNPHNPKNRRP